MKPVLFAIKVNRTKRITDAGVVEYKANAIS